MFSKRSLEGYLLIDQRAGARMPASAPGTTEALPGVPEGGILERSIYTCSHCQKGVIVNPLRTRDRGYCPKCDHYVCDSCETVRIQTGICKTYKQVVNEAFEKAVKGQLNG